MKYSIVSLAIGMTLSLTAPSQAADLKLAGIFTNHAVLQRDRAVPVWGWAEPGAEVTLEFADQKVSATAGADGKWMARLEPMPASSEARTLVVDCKATHQRLQISDLLVGDLWLCSGQSNMGICMDIPSNAYLQECIKKANNQNLRYFGAWNQFRDQPAADNGGAWQSATDGKVKGWSAIPYIFGDKLQRELGVPVGVVVSPMGGTPIETWIPREVLQANPAGVEFIARHEKLVTAYPEAKEKHDKALAEFKAKFPDAKALEAENAARKLRGEPPLREPAPPGGAPDSGQNPSACFNGKIAPLVPMALKGVLWYQGEANHAKFADYPGLMNGLMKSWRNLFEAPNLPFIMTELAPYKEPSDQPEDSTRSRFGEGLAQLAKADGNAWVITIVDGGEPKEIHPPKKEIPGERFAAMALAKIYGKEGMAHGPVFNSCQAQSGGLAVKFDAAGKGLVAKAVNLAGYQLSASELRGFEIAGEDRRFVRASASIQGTDTVLVHSDEVVSPVAVRYAWGAFPLCNLFNTEGFAAYPFRSDDWPWPTPEVAKK